jgi:peptidyl-prolyl cis-trans isomerase A (cyclophilin A)
MIMTRFARIAAAVALTGGLVLSASAQDEEKSPVVKMSTTLGDIVIVLNGEKAPISVKNFLRYVDEKYYDGTIFHRVMPTFMIQGGGFTPEIDKKEGAHEQIKSEWRNGLKNDRGTIAMARLPNAPNSATNQFFINVVDNASLDAPRDGAAYAVFGRVGTGMDVVDKIRNTKCAVHPKYGGGRQPVVPVEPVIIKSVTRVTGDEAAKARETAAKADAQAGAAAEKREADARAAAAKKREAAIAQAERSDSEFAAKLKKVIAEGKKTPSGLITLVTKPGDGRQPKKTDQVQVHYTGWLTNGKKFDSSIGKQPATFPLNRVIAGWTEGVGLMKVGETRLMLIPPDMAYGPAGRPGIPPNSELVFEVELLAIK